MLFNSIQFLIFFPLVVFFYFAIPHRFRWVLLLAASYFFYMCWRAEYILLIIISTAIDYIAGLQMGKHNTRAARRPWLYLSLIANLGLLFGFKYFRLFSTTLSQVLATAGIDYSLPALNLLLPIGISFYTFQTLSYSIDIYRGDRVPERHLGYFALYVAYFPQLVAGPIERSTRLLPQLKAKFYFDDVRVLGGLKLMFWGFIQKVVVADSLAPYVNEVYNNPGSYRGLPIWIATFLFAFQIYCDFSGYTDIARGAARVMGIKLMNNFNRPYHARSIADFWRRWHISLSTWFRDYLYIPLGGSRVKGVVWIANICAVFLISGLWHGANWTFVIWGGLHGLYFLFFVLIAPLTRRFQAACSGRAGQFVALQTGKTCTFALVLFAWIFFRANSVADAVALIRQLPSLERIGLDAGQGGVFMIKALFLILLVETVHWIKASPYWRERFFDLPLPLRWSAYVVGVLIFAFFGVFHQAQEFIYFQF